MHAVWYWTILPLQPFTMYYLMHSITNKKSCILRELLTKESNVRYSIWNHISGLCVYHLIFNHSSTVHITVNISWFAYGSNKFMIHACIYSSISVLPTQPNSSQSQKVDLKKKILLCAFDTWLIFELCLPLTFVINNVWSSWQHCISKMVVERVHFLWPLT